MDLEEIQKNFEIVYQEESSRVFRFITLRVADREEALDITEEVFYKYWQIVQSGESIKNSKAWLMTVARNKVIDWYKKKKLLSLDFVDSEGDENYSIDIADPSAHEKIDLSAEASFVLNTLEKLPSQYKEVILLRFVEELSPKEIAEILGVSANAASLRINHALQRLREITGINIEEK